MGVTLHAQASPFVRHEEARHDQDWEPLDSTSLDDPLTPAEAEGDFTGVELAVENELTEPAVKRER